MNTYEDLEKEACEDGIEIFHHSFKNEALKGLCVDDTITLNTNLSTTAEKRCVLAEELGHCYTSHGDILNMASACNRKQEYRARIWAYKKLISLDDLYAAFKTGRRKRYEIAEYLEVTEPFLDEALSYFKTKYPYGLETTDYIIYFIPNLQILTMFD